MPIYEYVCEDCGNKFEKLVRRTEDTIACPGCGESHLTPALSTFATPFEWKSKGIRVTRLPGWHVPVAWNLRARLTGTPTSFHSSLWMVYSKVRLIVPPRLADIFFLPRKASYQM